ncbi:hypothetical protein NERG_02665 [Nematocida ausubeli]|uniref:Uncharacterized protein n=1 Tax=Nematocida ausubeli (strain ATCC PRA-371 / ERTm2) TaxID=1913371 RepID=H8ZGE4_NEMA1|nr:hypothetical protein NERG_02665 [Nematocida ausubeli]
MPNREAKYSTSKGRDWRVVCILCLAAICTIVGCVQEGEDQTRPYALTDANAMSMDTPKLSKYQRLLYRLACPDIGSSYAKDAFLDLDSEDFDLAEIEDIALNGLLSTHKKVMDLLKKSGIYQRAGLEEPVSLLKKHHPKYRSKIQEIEDITRKEKELLLNVVYAYIARENQKAIMERTEEMRHSSKARYMEYLVEGIEYLWWQCKAMKECLVYANALFTRVSLMHEVKIIEKECLMVSGCEEEVSALNMLTESCSESMKRIESSFDYIDKVYVKKVNKLFRIAIKIERYIKLCISKKDGKECKVFVEVLSKVYTCIKDTLPKDLILNCASKYRKPYLGSMRMYYDTLNKKQECTLL